MQITFLFKHNFIPVEYYTVMDFILAKYGLIFTDLAIDCTD